MKRKLFAFLFAVMLFVGCITVGVSAADGVATFDALQTAVNNAGTDVIKLTAAIDGDKTLTVTKDVYLDLNGYDITCPVEVTGGTLYCMDSQTDDYTVKNAETGKLTDYGKLTNASGNVAGVPADADCAEDGYLMVKDEQDNSLSFHRVNLQIYSMALRAETVGLYYKSKFGGDEIVAANVDRFGLALSVQEIPTAENLAEKCECSYFTGFVAGLNNQDRTSTLLKNVMKTTNSPIINYRNSEMPVHGRAYILTKGGEYVFGNPVERDLVEQVQLAASDEYWKPMVVEKKNTIISMYKQYKDIMRNWKISNVESALVWNAEAAEPKEDNALKVLVITSSFGKNTTQLFYDVAKAQGKYDDVVIGRLYGSGCSLQKHLRNIQGDLPFYQYTRISNATNGKWELITQDDEECKTGTKMSDLLNGQYAEDWDVIFIQQGAAVSPQPQTYVDENGRDYIDQVTDYIKANMRNKDARFVWNMVWAYQGDSIIEPFPSLFNSDQMFMYQSNVDCVMKYVVPRTDFDWIIPSGTVMQNARTSYFGDKLCNDTYHLNNLGAVLTAYGMYTTLTGEPLTEIKLDAEAVTALNGVDRDVGSTRVPAISLTEEDKLVIMESVNNALKNPFGVTTSKYPPFDSYTYAENLSFFGDTKVAVCPACKAKKTWVEINKTNLAALTTQYKFGESRMDAGNYHFYLSEDIEFTGTEQYSFLHAAGSNINVCLHLNGNDLTSTNWHVAYAAYNSKINIMGTGTVTGNRNSGNKYYGSTIAVTSNNSTDPAAIRLYSGTYVQPAGNPQSAVISTANNGGVLEIYEDVTVTSNAGQNSIFVNTTNNNYPETVNIYGGTFNSSIYCGSWETAGSATTSSSLNIYGGDFKDQIKITDLYTNVKLSGAPVIRILSLTTGATITLDDLVNGADISVSATGAFTVANPLAADYVKYFKAYREGYSITEANGVLSSTQG